MIQFSYGSGLYINLSLASYVIPSNTCIKSIIEKYGVRKHCSEWSIFGMDYEFILWRLRRVCGTAFNTERNMVCIQHWIYSLLKRAINSNAVVFISEKLFHTLIGSNSFFNKPGFFLKYYVICTHKFVAFRQFQQWINSNNKKNGLVVTCYTRTHNSG